jgi:YVTN family beta-propeller protein
VALVYNPNNNKLYCANQQLRNVNVIDGSGDSIITTIQIGSDSEPSSLVYNSTNNKVYSGNNGNVTVINGTTNQVITNIPTGRGSCTLVYNPTNNKIYYANSESNNVMVIEGIADSVITTIGVGERPIAFTYNPLQNRVYVANYYGSSISVIRDVAGIEENKILDAERTTPEISPNPCRGLLQIRIAGNQKESAKIQIYDALGRRVKETEIPTGLKQFNIDLRKLSDGVYPALRFCRQSMKGWVYFVSISDSPTRNERRKDEGRKEASSLGTRPSSIGGETP